jgi:peptide/nickel transport system ATP-binding protein
MSALEVEGLTVEYRQRGGGRLRAVQELSFRLEPGQTLALVGESGSGKSTVVRTLARFIKPTRGRIALAGVPTRRGRPEVHEYRRKLQLVFQDPFASLNPMHTVYHHLARPIKRHRRARGREQVEAAVLELLRAVNLTPAQEVARKHPHELSGGQRQRVAIARSLATNPSVLLADEPVSMLDVSIRLEILNLLDRLKRERDLALLYVTHDLATARYFAKDIMVLYRGEVVERGPADEVILKPAHPYTQALAEAAPDPHAGRDPDDPTRARALARSAEHREAKLEEGCTFRSRCPHAMDVCGRRPPELPVAGSPDHSARCWLLN